MVRKILAGFILLIIIQSISIAGSNKERIIKPILPLEMEEKDYSILFFTGTRIELLRPPIASEKSAKKAAAKLKKLAKKSSEEINEAQLENFKALFSLSAKLANYYREEKNAGLRSKKLLWYTKRSLKYADLLVNNLKDQKTKNEIRYYCHITKMLLSEYDPHGELSDLMEIKNQLDQNLRQNIDLLLAAQLTQSPVTLPEGMKSLMNALGKASPIEAIGIHLCLAKGYAGLGEDFTKIDDNADPKYLDHLNKTLLKAEKMPPWVKERALNLALIIWYRVQNQDDLSWQDLRIDLKGYIDIPLTLALRERQVLGYLKENKYPQLFKGYEEILRYVKDERTRFKFGRKLMDIEYAYYLSLIHI